MYEQASTPESKDIQLKTDIERLFSLEFSEVFEQSEWTIFLARTTIRQFRVRNMPENALKAACDGLSPQRVVGYPAVSFDRYQTSWRFFGQEKINTDKVHLNVTFYDFSGGTGSESAYIKNIDMTKLTVEYDERFASVVRACLEQPSDSL